MKKIICSLLAVLSVSMLMARPKDRHVVLDSVCDCTPQQFQHTIDKFFFQFQTNSDSIFQWAYLNTEGDGNHEEGGKDAIGLKYVYAKYDPLTHTGDLAVDIYVLGSKMFPDRHLITVNHGSYMTATYSGSILDDASIIFRLDSVAPQKTKIHYEFNLVFGRFISLFISDKTWNNAIRWRLEQIFYNLIEYTETGTVTKKKKQ